MIDFASRFVRDPNICNGQVTIKGTRVMLRTILASLADGSTDEEILADFPSITREDLRAVIAFAAASAEEDLPIPAAPAI